MLISKHNDEIKRNLVSWKKKPLLRKIYRQFYRIIAAQLSTESHPCTVELGSGIGKIKEIIPHCVTTDLFSNPWVDRVENAYQLSFADNSIGNLILFDIFHHLRYPETALCEFHRVLAPQGRVIIFDPCLSLLGLLVYGVFHKEDLGLGNEIQRFAPTNWKPEDDSYYAGQGNAFRLFMNAEYCSGLEAWNVLLRQRLSAISYVCSGGYSGPQIYPDKTLPLMNKIDVLCDFLPGIFATRLLVVLGRKELHYSDNKGETSTGMTIHEI